MGQSHGPLMPPDRNEGFEMTCYRCALRIPCGQGKEPTYLCRMNLVLKILNAYFRACD